MSRLDALRKLGYTSYQLMLMAKSSGDPLIAAEADAQAVRERLRKGPKKTALLPLEAEVTTQAAARQLEQAFNQYRQVAR